MRYLIVFLITCATPAFAQDVTLDRQMVDRCFATAQSDVTNPGCIGAAAERCMAQTSGGYSTTGMTACVAAETAIWDGYLNREYQDLRAQMRAYDADAFAGDVSRADALRDAQRAWIAYRDTECAFNWAMFQEGTIRSNVAAGCMLEFTATRALELRNYREIPG